MEQEPPIPSGTDLWLVRITLNSSSRRLMPLPNKSLAWFRAVSLAFKLRLSVRYSTFLCSSSQAPKNPSKSLLGPSSTLFSTWIPNHNQFVNNQNSMIIQLYLECRGELNLKKLWQFIPDGKHQTDAAQLEQLPGCRQCCHVLFGKHVSWPTFKGMSNNNCQNCSLCWQANLHWWIRTDGKANTLLVRSYPLLYASNRFTKILNTSNLFRILSFEYKKWARLHVSSPKCV